MLDTSILVHTDRFDGPLGLLLLLIQKEEMDLRQLDLNKITGQYLATISKMEEMNFDMAGEYLYLAATLLYLKSKTALSEEDAMDLQSMMGADSDLNILSRADLIGRLEELEQFQKLGAKLWALPRQGLDIFSHPKIDRRAVVDSILLPMDLQKLTMSMVDFLRKEKRKFNVVKRDRLSIQEKLQKLKAFFQVGQQTDLEEVIAIDGERSIQNIVITFISLLELARLRKIEIFQNEKYSTVYVNVLQSLQDFDVNDATGFDPEDAKPHVALDLPPAFLPEDNETQAEVIALDEWKQHKLTEDGGPEGGLLQ
jgi:segregation and condensation protein A